MWYTGRYSSGQRGGTVNPLAQAYQGSNPCLPTTHDITNLLGSPTMAKKGARGWVWMVAETKGESTHRFQTERNKTNLKEKLRIKRFAPDIKKSVWFKETK
jgi:ribosomal protein L33